MEQHHAEAKKSNQDGVGDTDTQPSGGAGAEEERMNVTENSSHSLWNCQSNKGHHSRPSDSGENEWPAL